MKRIRVNEAELDYIDEGSGTPVVFSHGGSSDIRYWEPQRRTFAGAYRFVAYSQRLHGSQRSGADRVLAADAHAKDLADMMRRLNAGPVHLVGFSRATALYVTLAEPQLVRSLTIIEPNVPWVLHGDPDGEAVYKWWLEENERVREAPAGDAELRARLWFELVNNDGPGAFAHQAQAFRRMWLHNFDAPKPAGAAQPITCADLASIVVPTLVIATERSTPYSQRIAERVARCVKSSRLVVVPGATHFVSYQQPAVFNEIVLRFLAEH